MAAAMRPSERMGRPIGAAGLECWVGCAMNLYVTALLCCYLIGMYLRDARVWGAYSSTSAIRAPLRVARRAAEGGGQVLLVLVR